MDTIFYNGTIYTQDQAYPACSAIAVKNGVIAALGSDQEMLALASSRTERIDLAGRFVVPGFIDSHLHFIYDAMVRRTIDLSETKSLSEAMELCRGRVSEISEKGGWLLAGGFNQDDWIEKTMPTRTDLDAISEEVPVVLQRACLHISVCNTKALALSGLLESCPDGIVREQMQNAISEAEPLPDLDELKELIQDAARAAARAGITEVHTDDFTVLPGTCGKLILQAYRELSEAGKLDVRIYEQCNLETLPELKQFLAAGHRTGDDYGFFRIGPLKIITDGSLGAHTAAMLAPYCNAPETCGVLNYTDEKLQEMISLAQEYGMQMAIHCIGDGALEQTLNALRRAHYENPKANLRHGIVHCQIMSEKQQDWFQKLNLLAYIQPIFVRYDMHIVEDCVGEELEATSYNWRRFAELGVHQCAGSDCPVEKFDILPNLQYAVTRKDPVSGKTWYPQYGLTLEEALRAFTYEGAYAGFSEGVRGTISVSKYADLTVLDRNLFEIPAEEISEAKVVLTMTGGKVTYRAIS
ncbi:amidohydrolase [Emergencia sp. 1XD21-10]|uniref:amidohydrolase n=1 Tax=Emergencia sp. 1XD21-10 TaxID=2304569 RepID=UPI00137B3100|nr:amidohydrolase [Emergencia sp. 1XD21-10]NCE98075.1 amidohydrolase [Emergencia sp. 1XD21-10]